MSGVELKLIPIEIIRLKINKSTCKHMYIDVKESHLDTLGLTKGLNLCSQPTKDEKFTSKF